MNKYFQAIVLLPVFLMPWLLFSCVPTKYHLEKNKITLKDGDLKGKVKWVKSPYDFSIYDENGDLIYRRHTELVDRNISHYQPDTVTLHEDFFKYDNKGNLIEHLGDMLFKQKQVNTYDKMDRVIESDYFQPDTSVKDKNIFLNTMKMASKLNL